MSGNAFQTCGFDRDWIGESPLCTPIKYKTHITHDQHSVVDLNPSKGWLNQFNLICKLNCGITGILFISAKSSAGVVIVAIFVALFSLLLVSLLVILAKKLKQ